MCTEYGFQCLNRLLQPEIKLIAPHSIMDRHLNIRTDYRRVETKTKDGRLVGVDVDNKRVYQINDGQIAYTQCSTINECADAIKRIIKSI